MLGTDKEICATLALLLTPDVGYVTVKRLMTFAQVRDVGLADLVNATPRRLTEWLPSGYEALGARVIEARRLAPRAAALLRAARKLGVTFLAIHKEGYPQSLRTCLGDDCPPLLSCLGDTAQLTAVLGAVVGTRSPSPEGVEMGRVCARSIVESGGGVVSGGAEGIDTVAHRTAIESGGRTAIVLPQGILTYAVDSDYRVGIERGDVTVVSQFAPDLSWQTHAAVMRNAVIASLARCVCVIEPRRMGGSVRTGRIGLRQRKPVFCGDPSGISGRPLEALLQEGAIAMPSTVGAPRIACLAAAVMHGSAKIEKEEYLF